jgi:DNA-directed RNA polymerase beta' subunit
MHKGYTLSLLDLIPSKLAISQIDLETTKIINESNALVSKLNKGKLVPPIGMTLEEFYEKQQINITSSSDNFYIPLIQNMDTYNNNFYKMYVSGSKGSSTNMTQVSSTIGQILQEGNRMKQNFSYGRTLPYYLRFDTSPESRGYISGSFIVGIDPIHCIFGFADSRINLVHRALTTSVTGQNNRKSIKNLESIYINNCRQTYKGDFVIQLLYGNDGLDPRKIETVYIPTIMLNNKKIEEYHMHIDNFNEMFRNNQVQQLLDEEFQQIVNDKTEYISISLNVESYSSQNKLLTNKIYMPFNLQNSFK